MCVYMRIYRERERDKYVERSFERRDVADTIRILGGQ